MRYTIILTLIWITLAVSAINCKKSIKAEKSGSTTDQTSNYSDRTYMLQGFGDILYDRGYINISQLNTVSTVLINKIDVKIRIHVLLDRMTKNFIKYLSATIKTFSDWVYNEYINDYGTNAKSNYVAFISNVNYYSNLDDTCYVFYNFLVFSLTDSISQYNSLRRKIQDSLSINLSNKLQTSANENVDKLLFTTDTFVLSGMLNFNKYLYSF